MLRMCGTGSAGVGTTAANVWHRLCRCVSDCCKRVAPALPVRKRCGVFFNRRLAFADSSHPDLHLLKLSSLYKHEARASESHEFQSIGGSIRLETESHSLALRACIGRWNGFLAPNGATSKPASEARSPQVRGRIAHGCRGARTELHNCEFSSDSCVGCFVMLWICQLKGDSNTVLWRLIVDLLNSVL